MVINDAPQWDRRDIGHGLACYAAAIMIGQHDQRAVWGPDAHHVPIAQYVRKPLVTTIVFPLIEEAIRRSVLWL